MKRPFAIILHHDHQFGSGLFIPALVEQGFNVEQRRHEFSPRDVTADLLISLGGAMSVSDVRRYPSLVEELRLMRKRLASNRPTIGICLGAQLLAVAAGGSVRAMAAPRVAVHSPLLADAARRRFLAPDAVNVPRFASWHEESITLSRGTVLAHSPDGGCDIFEVGNSIGFQGHPEVDAVNFERWVRRSPEFVSRAKRDVHEVIAREVPRLRESEPVNLAFLTHLLGRFARDAAHRRAGLEAGAGRQASET